MTRLVTLAGQGLLAAALAVVASTPAALAQTTATNTQTTATPDPAREARIAALVAAFPDAATSEPEPFDDARLAKLVKANPGHETELHAMVADLQRCETEKKTRDVAGMMHDTVARLNDDQIASLTRFYKSDDFKRFSALADRQDAGETLTAEEAAQVDAISKRPDVLAFYAAMQAQTRAFFAAQLQDMPGPCERQLDAALSHAGLKNEF